jgi:hypothetical protein
VRTLSEYKEKPLLLAGYPRPLTVDPRGSP